MCYDPMFRWAKMRPDGTGFSCLTGIRVPPIGLYPARCLARSNFLRSTTYLLQIPTPKTSGQTGGFAPSFSFFSPCCTAAVHIRGSVGSRRLVLFPPPAPRTTSLGGERWMGSPMERKAL